MRIIPALSVGLMALTLSACGERDNDSGPGGVTVGEARALDEAAEMIEQRRLPEDALREPSPADEESAGTPDQSSSGS